MAPIAFTLPIQRKDSLLTKTLKRFLTLLLLFCACALASADAIDNVTVENSGNRSIITINLNRRMTYLSNSPAKTGDLLIIQLMPLDLSSVDLASNARQSFPWTARDGSELTEVIFDYSRQTQPFISLRFNKSVNFTVNGVPDALSLIVTVLHSSSAQHELSPSQRPLESGVEILVPVTIPPLVKKLPPSVSLAQINRQMSEYMEQGKTAIIDGNYNLAADLYFKALALPENDFSLKALEYFGLAKELNGESDAAKSIYTTFMRRYPKGQDHERVSQRFQSLQTAEFKPIKKLRETENANEISATPSVITDFYGTSSNFYNGFVLLTDEGSEMVQSTIQADLYLSGRIQSGDWDIRTNFTGGHLADTLGNGGSGDHTRITNGFLDINNKAWRASARLGRQVGYNGGILGRFDGINGGVMVTDQIRLNAVFGFPVEYASITRADQFNFFYGLNADFLNINGPLDSNIDFNAFFIQQFAENIQDRLAIGGDMKFFTDSINIFSQFDYDLLYDSLNILNLSGNWRLPSQTSLNLLLDYRNAPLLTTSNALLGNTTASDVDDLLQILTIDQVRDIARRNTVASYTGSVGFSHPINDRFQIGGDFTATKLGAIPDTFIQPPGSLVNPVNIEGIDATGWEYFTTLQFFSNHNVIQGDFLGLNLQYAHLETSNRYGATIDARYPVNLDFDVSPRFRIDYRKGQQGVNDWLFRPSLRMRYQVRQGIRLEAEFGGEFSTHNVADNRGSFTDGNYYFVVGYRIDFTDFY